MCGARKLATAAVVPARNERRLRLMATSSRLRSLHKPPTLGKRQPVASRLLVYMAMKTIAAIFGSRADAERAAQHLIALGTAPEHLTVLSPGAHPREAVATDEGEAQGTGAAIGAVVGGATGASIGMPLGAAISLMVPGVGPVIALGLVGAALFSAAGAAVGSALETKLSQGVPRD